jgi:predicted nucleic acid-binding protein
MHGFLLDTNHLSDTIRPVSVVRDRIQQQQRAGIRFRSCIPVLCEIEVGIQQAKYPSKYYRLLDQVLRVVRLWPLDRVVAVRYAELYLRAREAGRALSYVDLILGALAKLNDVTLLTTDQDFKPFTDIKTENWLA